MSNPLLQTLPPSPFVRLRALLADISPPPDAQPRAIALDVGSPRHPPPECALAALRTASDYGAYPRIDGIAEWHDAIAQWLMRRFGLDAAFLQKLGAPLPLSGTREGLFLAAQLAPAKPDGMIAMPNPFYQLYAVAARAAGADPLYLDTARAQNFLPALSDLSPDICARLRAFYVCNPANPQGAVASRDYLRALYKLAKQHNFLLLVDECYSDIYDCAPPPSMLEIMADADDADAPVLVFHSLSKRSNLAGLRSGFALGGATAMKHFLRVRQIAGAQSPLASQRAAAAAWRDETHVVENRRLYREKLDLAEEILAGQFDFYRPAGGFFLWLNVGDGEAVARHLWRKAGVRVLPGAYLAAGDAAAIKSYAPYIRVALVAPYEETHLGLQALAENAHEVAA